MNRVCFFGGSFDPPHIGHLGVAQGAVESGMCRRVVWVPAWMPPHKQTRERADFLHRFAMVEALIENENGMSVSDLERRLQLNPSYTYSIMQHFARELDADEAPAILIGADSLLQLHTWFRTEDLVREFDILTYPRPGYAISREKLLEHWPEKSADKLLSGVLDGRFFEISSTAIRKSMAKSGNMEHINNSVIPAYCREHGLYLEQEKGKSMNAAENNAVVSPADLAEFCAACAREKLAENVVAIEIGKVSSVADYMVIGTATSEPQLRALTGFIEREVLEKLKKKTLHRPEVSSGDCNWVLLDFGTVIVHLMMPETRERYNLEGLWGRK